RHTRLQGDWSSDVCSSDLCDLHPIDFAAVAHACGGTGFTIEDPHDCGRTVEQALNTPGPVLVQAVVDPFEPPMPPKITLKQAAKIGRASCREREESQEDDG